MKKTLILARKSSNSAQIIEFLKLNSINFLEELNIITKKAIGNEDFQSLLKLNSNNYQNSITEDDWNPCQSSNGWFSNTVPFVGNLSDLTVNVNTQSN